MSRLQKKYKTELADEIRQKLGLSRERIRQLEMRAIKKLRHPSCRKRWTEFVEN